MSNLNSPILPHICWGRMNDHTICVRLDNADPEKKYRVIFDGEHPSDPDDEGLFWFFDAQPMRRYRIGCEVMSGDGVWEECCPDIVLNFVPPLLKPTEESIVHLSGGERASPVQPHYIGTAAYLLRDDSDG